MTADKGNVEHAETRENKSIRLSSSSMKDPERVFSGGFLAVFSWFSESKFRRIDLLALGIYGALIGFGTWYHEPWGDEAFPWVIARDADWKTFLTILLTNQDKHPGLFYCILLPFAKLGFPYFTQAILNVLFALTAAFLFVARAPFSRILKYLFLFSFFMAYEYAVITRTYMLSVMLIFCIAAFYSKRSQRPMIYAALVTLLFHTDFMNFGLGVGLTLAFAIENRERLFKDRSIGLAFLIMLANALLIFWIGHSLPKGHPDLGEVIPVRLENLTKSVANAFFPFSDFGLHAAFKAGLAVLAGAVIIALVFISLIPTPIPGLILGASLGNLFLIFLFLHPGNYRHHGFILISVLFALWISEVYSRNADPAIRKWGAALLSKFRKMRITALIVVGVLMVFGLRSVFFAHALEYSRFFSGAKIMAEAIKKAEGELHFLKQGFVIVAKHRSSIGLMPYLPGVRFWNPCTGNYAAFYKVDKKLAACDDLPPYVALQLAKERLGDLSKTLLLFERPLPIAEDKNYYYQKVFFVDKRVFGYMKETFFLYLPLPKAPAKEVK